MPDAMLGALPDGLPGKQCTYERTNVLTKNLLDSQRISRLSDARTRAETEGVR